VNELKVTSPDCDLRSLEMVHSIHQKLCHFLLVHHMTFRDITTFIVNVTACLPVTLNLQFWQDSY